MISKPVQVLLSVGLLTVAGGALVLGAIYQDDDKLGDAVIVGLNDDAQPGGGISGEAGGSDAGGAYAGAAGGPSTSGSSGGSTSGPIERFLPRGSEASACSEAVGVDLVDEFAATLTINGIAIAPEEMNVNLDENGRISEVVTASRSLGHFTFLPDDDCPNGRYLRPVDNVLEVCVYRVSDPSRACAVQTEHIFDAL